MKILLLLSGYTCKRVSWEKGGNGTYKNNMDDFFSGSKYLNKLLKKHDVISICSIWDDIGKEEVMKSYKPKICVSLDQNRFQDNLKKIIGNYESNTLKKREKWFEKKNVENNLVIPVSRFASQLFARQVVTTKALEFLINSSFKPDLIILTRYDISCRGGIFVRNPVKITKNIIEYFSQKNQIPKVVLPEFNQLNAGLPDMWFYLNLTALKKMQFIYDDYINSLISSKSKYKELLTKGWPKSEWFDLSDIRDKRQFTNLIITGEEPKRLMKYKEWELPNIHTFYKYYLLLKKVKFEVKFISKIDSIKSMLLFSDLFKALISIGLEIISSSKLKFKSIKKI